MKRKPKAPRARNYLVVLAIRRKAGVHSESSKARRRHDQVEHLRGVAQLAEHPALNRTVLGSIPSAPTNFFHKRMHGVFLRKKRG